MARRGPGRIKAASAVLLAALAFVLWERTDSPPAARWYDQQKERIRSRGGISYAGELPVHGIVFETNAKGDTLRLVPFVNGKEHGLAKTFYDNGQLKELRRYVNGKKEGRHYGWYENGRLQWAYGFKDDMYDGTLEEWYVNGKLSQRLAYKDGHQNGAQQCWFPNGTVKSNYLIQNNRRYGLLGTKNCVNVSDSIGM